MRSAERTARSAAMFLSSGSQGKMGEHRRLLIQYNPRLRDGRRTTCVMVLRPPTWREQLMIQTVSISWTEPLCTN
jgi:hypothetical protein